MSSGRQPHSHDKPDYSAYGYHTDDADHHHLYPTNHADLNYDHHPDHGHHSRPSSASSSYHPRHHSRAAALWTPAQPRRSPPAYVERSNIDDQQQDSPPPDEDLLAYIRTQQAQQHAASSSSSTSAIPQSEVERIKLARFQGANTKKSRFQRQKQEADKKAKQAEQDAEKAYTDFLEAMQSHHDHRRCGPTSNSTSKGFVGAGGQSVYQAFRPPPPPAPATSNKPSLAAFGQEPDDEPTQPEKPRKDPPGKRKRAMDDFLGELQRDQAQREERLRSKVGEGGSISSLIALEGQKIGSRDLGDPMTTNVCVMNLPANVSEESLGEFFAQWGDVGTVKIMWPRGDEAFGGVGTGITSLRKDRSAGLTGFVAYMHRQDAEYALKQTDGIRWGGSLIKTGWSKAMPLPSRPLHKMPASSSKLDARGARSDIDGPLPPPHMRAQPAVGSQKNSHLVIKHRRPLDVGNRPPSPRTATLAALDAQDSLRRRIETVAARVKEVGPRLEESIRENAKDDDTYAFVGEGETPAHHYYRMCLDPAYEPELPPRPFDDEGTDSLYSTDTGEESEDARLRRPRRMGLAGTAPLSPLARHRFEAMLRGLTPRRERIARLMAFAIDHAHSADEIGRTLIASLLIPSTPLPRKLARLHVISDILHNCAAPLANAWKYRATFEPLLCGVFRHFRQVRLSFPGRMKQEMWRRSVEAVLDVWEGWMVFAQERVGEWRREFDVGSRGDAKREEGEEGQGGGEGEGEEDLDGVEFQLPLDGAGETVDDDLDGEEM